MPAKKVTFDAEMERIYQTYPDRPSEEDAAAIILGDPSYGRRVKMPKWSMLVTMLQEPKVALRYWHSWGIPTSKEAHHQRAEYFEQLHGEYEDTYRDLVAYACDAYGDHGPLVSGVVHDHFPVHVKNRLRFLSRAKNLTSDARRLHEFLSRTRAPAFT
jgi:hypothetical protein